VIGGLALGRGEAFVDLGAAEADVLGAVEGERFGGGAVAPGAADFLIVAFDRFRQVGMGDPADVGLVDSHAKGHCRDDDQAILALEAGFNLAAVVGLHACVVVAGGVACLAERLREGFGLGPGGGVDDAGLASARISEIEDLAAGLVLDLEGEVNVGAVEAAQEGCGLLSVE
jgi:hypothetical protein